MNAFAVCLQGATQFERLEDVVSFVGEDGSGSFGLMAGHARFVTTLVFGLSRVRYADGRLEYLAMPGGVAYFDGGEITLSTRRYLRGDDFKQMSKVLREELAKEVQELAEFKSSLEQMERAMMLRLWRIGHGEEGGG